MQGGYRSPISALSNRLGWTGSSGSYMTTRATMPASAAGQSVKLRWRIASDTIVGGSGWSVDTLNVYGIQCAVGRRQPPQVTSSN